MGFSTGVAPAMPSNVGANFAEVEWISRREEVGINFVSAFDVGRPFNRQMWRDKLSEGVMMGIGFARTENSYSDGRIVNNILEIIVSCGHAMVPHVEEILLRATNDGPFGAKGVGEATQIGVPARNLQCNFQCHRSKGKDFAITRRRFWRGCIQRG